MIKLTEAQIDNIAQEVEIGMVCYIHKETGEMVSFPDEMRGNEPEEEFWGEDMAKVEENYDSYVRVEGMHSSDAYKVMERFAETVEDEALGRRLIRALNRRGPFQNFKYEIDESGEYRQKWFDFKSQETINWVKEQLFIDEYEE